ncbi:unnamed protein product [Orchesella dallaii]|uniref:L-xylulose reductase n=1 Tax=Orchesella dallaii TaxID=48710 RepID=A0ABP1QBR8_9HEXA
MDSYVEFFSGRRVLITGAGKGLGYALVKKFYENNALVFALDKKQAYLDALKVEFPNVTTICVDLRDWDETRRLVKSIAPIDHLVNNAAISGTSFFEDISPEQIDGLFSVNFKAVVNVSQAVVKGLIQHERAQGGTIVNISSVFDTTPSKGISIYSCTKAAILMLTKSLALELGDHGIRVNSISPAPTAMLKEMFVSPNPKIVHETQKVLDRQVIKRPVQPAEAADLVLFLSSPNSAMITGSSVPIDGGIFSR